MSLCLHLSLSLFFSFYFLHTVGIRSSAALGGVGLLLQDLLKILGDSTLKKLFSPPVNGAETISGSTGLGHLLWLQVDVIFRERVCNGIL